MRFRSFPTPSGQPVECRALQITGTPANWAAIRPQNILSPAPTVTTASMRFRFISRASRKRTRRSYFDVSRSESTGTSLARSSPKGPFSFKQATCGSIRVRRNPRIKLTRSVSAPPTGMLVIKKRVFSGRAGDASHFGSDGEYDGSSHAIGASRMRFIRDRSSNGMRTWASAVSQRGKVDGPCADQRSANWRVRQVLDHHEFSPNERPSLLAS
jgi:hypothetical protein